MLRRARGVHIPNGRRQVRLCREIPHRPVVLRVYGRAFGRARRVHFRPRLRAVPPIGFGGRRYLARSSAVRPRRHDTRPRRVLRRKENPVLVEKGRRRRLPYLRDGFRLAGNPADYFRQVRRHRAQIPANGRNRVQLHALRAGDRLLGDGSQQPLHHAFRRLLYAQGRFRPGVHHVSDRHGGRECGIHPLGLQRQGADFPAGAVFDEARRFVPDGALRQQVVVPYGNRPRAADPGHGQIHRGSPRAPHRPARQACGNRPLEGQAGKLRRRAARAAQKGKGGAD